MMRRRPQDHVDGDRRNPRGVILLITLVILVILATLGYTVTARVGARRHRDQYIINSSQARYACASAMKYALTMIPELDSPLISRPNEPDFSDVFAMSEVEYQDLLARFAAIREEADGRDRQARAKQDVNDPADANVPRPRKKVNDTNNVDDADDVETVGVESLIVPGPYGPPWPLVAEPVEIEIGEAMVTIEIEDENAKYPLHWALIADEQWKTTADVGFVTFCEWMGYKAEDIAELQEDLAKVSAVRPFQLEIKPQPAAAVAAAAAAAARRGAPAGATGGAIPPGPDATAPAAKLPGETEAAYRARLARIAATGGTAQTPAQAPTSLRSRVAPGTTAAAAAARRPVTRGAVPVLDPVEQQTTDYVKLLHSSMIDGDRLSRPTVVSDSRQESAMKYLGLWTTKQVNINTAPRHVLEAALTFGSAANAAKMADEIIRQRQVKPFADIEEVKKAVFRYSDAVERCKLFLTTTSSVFTIRVTAVSGAAKSTMIVAVSKEGDKVKQIGVVSD